MAKPGVVPRRPVGTSAPFMEHASLPRNFANVVEGPAKHRPPTSKPHAVPIDAKAAREAAAKYEREQKQRDRAATRRPTTSSAEVGSSGAGSDSRPRRPSRCHQS